MVTLPVLSQTGSPHLLNPASTGGGIGIEGVNIPIKMAIIPPETCASSSSVSSRVGSRTWSVVETVFAVAMIVALEWAKDERMCTGECCSPQ